MITDSIRADLFLVLVRDLAAAVEPRAAISSVLERMRDTLGAQAFSLFVVDADGEEIRGAPGEWDWTRTSFTVPLAEWPGVRRALVQGTALHLTVAEASESERGWFEPRGIGATLCVPLCVVGRAIAVVFFDFTETTVHADEATMRFVEGVAAECAAALERAFRLEAKIDSARGAGTSDRPGDWL